MLNISDISIKLEAYNSYLKNNDIRDTDRLYDIIYERLWWDIFYMKNLEVYTRNMAI